MSEYRTAIKLENVSLSYRSPNPLKRGPAKPVLDKLDLEVSAGETLGIIGRNGAGKSTLLKVLAGILSPSTGKVIRNVGQSILLTYQLGFNSRLTGRQNAVYSALLQGMPREHIEEAMPDIIAFSGLGGAIDEPLNTYSSGMKARLGFAVTTQSQADVILIDEALGVGDHSFREKSAQFMREWIRSSKTAIFVSHDEGAVRNLCDRVAWLERGRIVAEGTPAEMLGLYYEFDEIVRGISEALKIPEEEVRAHENNRDPVAQVMQLRQELKEIWNKEDDPFGLGPNRVVKYFRPKQGMQLSQVAEESCGSWAWVESAKLVCRGGRQQVLEAYDRYNHAIAQLAAHSKSDPHQFRRSKAHDALLDFIECIGSIR